MSEEADRKTAPATEYLLKTVLQYFNSFDSLSSLYLNSVEFLEACPHHQAYLYYNKGDKWVDARGREGYSL